MVQMVGRILRAIGESERTISQMEKLLSPPDRYLYALDTLALVGMADDSHLSIKPRRPEWRELIPPLLKEAEPYKGEITRLVREREKGSCLHCSHWHPLNDSFGVCDLASGICGRLYGCERAETNHIEKSYLRSRDYEP